MSKKYLLFLIFVLFVSISVVSASDNAVGDVISVDNGDASLNLNNVVDSELSSGFDDDWEYYDTDWDDDEYYDWDYYYDKAVLKPTKLSTTYNSGKTFNVKVVSANDKSYTLEDVKLKLIVYTKNSYKDYYAYTNYNGVAKFKISNNALGTHKVKVSSADSYTSAKTVSSSIVIKKANTKVSAPRVTTKYKKSKTFKIKIKDKSNNKVVKNVKISVKVGYKTYTLKTNSKGVATFKTKSFGVGTYKVVIKSKNSKYNINAKSSIVIKSIPKKKSYSKSTSSSYGGGYYVGSVNSNVFHYPSCSAAKRIKSYNKISFSSRSNAISAGYRSCKLCYS